MFYFVIPHYYKFKEIVFNIILTWLPKLTAGTNPLPHYKSKACGRHLHLFLGLALGGKVSIGLLPPSLTPPSTCKLEILV